MSQHTYETLRQNKPNKFYANHRLAILMAYFRGEKTLEEISSDFDIPLSELNKWLRNEFADTAEYYNDLQTQIEFEQMPVVDANVESLQKVKQLESEVLELHREIRALRKTRSDESYEDLLYSVTGQR